MTATDDTNIDSADATTRLQAEALTDEGAFDKLMARGNITSVPATVAARITDWNGLTPAEESEARRKETQERDEYARQIEQVRERVEELRERLNEQEWETRQKIAEADARAIVLRDGRRVLVGKNGDYIEEDSGRKLDGDDKTEAAGKRQANSETEEEHKALRDRMAQINEARNHLRKAEDLAVNGNNLSATERKENAAQAQKEIAVAEAATQKIAYVEAGTDGDMAAALGLGSEKNDRSPSFAATLEGKDSQAIAMRDDFTASVQPGIAAAKTTGTPAPSSAKARTAAPA